MIKVSLPALFPRARRSRVRRGGRIFPAQAAGLRPHDMGGRGFCAGLVLADPEAAPSRMVRMTTTLAASPTSCAAPAAGRGRFAGRASAAEQGGLAFGLLLDMVLTPDADPQSLGSAAATTDAAVSPGLLFAPRAPATLAIAPPVSPGLPPDTSAAPIQGTGEPRPGLPTRRDALKGAKPAEAGENNKDKQAGSESGAVLASPAQLMSPAVQTPPAGEKHRAQAVAVPHDGSAQAAKPQSERPSLPPANPEPVAHPRAETPPVMPASPNADPSSPLRAEPASGGRQSRNAGRRGSNARARRRRPARRPRGDA